MKLKNLKSIIIALLLMTIMLLAAPLLTSVLASDCNTYPRPGCPDEITNNFYESRIDSAVALGSVIPDLLPKAGNSRFDIAVSDYGNANAVGATFMHSWAADGTVWEGVADSTSLGISAATGNGDGSKWLFRIQGGWEF